uniref:Uncharacterized protein n=1 Tax=Quercus lobata TaxID=97700 RepID=A0A7N2MQY4_QUELO
MIRYLIPKRLGGSTQLIINITCGKIGRGAVIIKIKEVKWRDNSIVLTVGYVPGLKVHAISLQQSVIRVTTLSVKQEC